MVIPNYITRGDVTSLDSSPVPITHKTFPTCRIKYQGVVESGVEQKVVGGDTKLSTGAIVAAVGSDNSIKLHLETNLQTQNGASEGIRLKPPSGYLLGQRGDRELDWLVSLVVVAVKHPTAVERHHSEGPESLFPIACKSKGRLQPFGVAR